MLENSSAPIDEISPEDWQKTPESVRRLVTNWLEQLGQLVERIEQLERQYEEVKSENQLGAALLR